MVESTSNAQVVPISPTPATRKLGAGLLPLPKAWPGFGLAGLLVLLEFSFGSLTGLVQAVGGRPASQLPKALLWFQNPTGPSVSLQVMAVLGALVYVAGMVYWFRSVYRIHSILAQVTNSSYPITAGKAVGYQFIPFYCIAWNFKWPGELAKFVNSRASSANMSKYWPGIFLLLASILSSADSGLQLIALSGIALYLTRKLASVDLAEPHSSMTGGVDSSAAPAIARSAPPVLVPAPVAVSAPARAFPRPAPIQLFKRWMLAAKDFDWSKARELRLSLAACSGATFGFLACYGLWTTIQQIKARDFSSWDLLVIAMIAFLLWQFIEPLFDLLKEVFTGKRSDEEDESFSVRSLVFLAFVAVVVASHTLLEKTHEQFPNGETIFVAGGLAILFGLLTYGLIRGTKSGIKETIKVIAGTVAVALLVGIVMAIGLPRAVLATWAPGPTLYRAAATAAGNVSHIDEGQAVNNASSVVAAGSDIPEKSEAEKKVGSLITGSKVILPFSAFIFLVLFGIFVVAKRRWGPREMALCGILCGIVAMVYGYFHHTQNIHLFACLWATTGWCVAVLAFCESDLLELQELHLALPKPQDSGARRLALYQKDSPLRREARVRFGALVFVFVLFILTCVVFAGAHKIYIVSSADRTARQYHQPNPDLSENRIAPEDGLETEGSPIIWTEATESSSPDVYAIHVQRGSLKVVRKSPGKDDEDLSDNYMFIPQQGELRVLPAESSVSLAPATATVSPDSPVPLTATVSSTLGTPTGTVTFMDGGTSLGTSAVSNGSASLPITLVEGLHLVTAEYNADNRNFQKSTSDAAQIFVGSGFVRLFSASSITLTSSAPSAAPNTPVTFTAKVIANGTNPAGTVPGTVTFKDNAMSMDTEPLSDGVGSFTTHDLRPGSHTITAEYSGGGSSNSLTETIGLAMVQPNIQVLPAGSPIAIRTIDPVDSTTARVGQIIRASLQSPPALFHAPATLRVVRVDPSGKLAGHSSVTLELESVTIGGRVYPVRTIPVERAGPSKAADTMKKTGIGAAIGGTVGGIFGHGKGAAVGAASGAGAGAAAAAFTPAGPARIPSETVLTFHLKASLSLVGAQ